MYTLLSGFHKYLTQKEEYYVIILGLDNAGKTVYKIYPYFLFFYLLYYEYINNNNICISIPHIYSHPFTSIDHSQTLLERIKSIFLGVMGLPPDRIAPTVGLNSTFSMYLLYMVNLNNLFYLV